MGAIYYITSKTAEKHMRNRKRAMGRETEREIVTMFLLYMTHFKASTAENGGRVLSLIVVY
jgi:hypothetical protein